jgi:glucan 1,3-beta-glucosidase
MATFSLLTLFVALRLLLLVSGAPAPAPIPVPAASDAAASSYWLASITRQGTAAFGTAGYQIFRNVKDFGAAGDGSTDDTAAINAAITAGSRCGQGCDSSTTTPALIYFPPGTYSISAPLIQLYYTQFVGDAVSVPTLKATAGFQGIALIDSDPYAAGGINWYTNQVWLSTKSRTMGLNLE